MENENETRAALEFGCRIPTSFASEKIGHFLRLEYLTQAVIIRKAGVEYRTLYRVFVFQEGALSEAAGPQE